MNGYYFEARNPSYGLRDGAGMGQTRMVNEEIEYLKKKLKFAERTIAQLKKQIDEPRPKRKSRQSRSPKQRTK